MGPRSVRPCLTAARLAISALMLCSMGRAKQDATTDAKGTKVSLTDKGCRPTPAKIPGGTVAVTVVNEGARSVSEAELRAADSQSILGERENLTPGLSGTFKLNLTEGAYKIYCPGAQQDTWDLVVEGGTKVRDWKDNPALVKAVNGYASYVNSQIAELVTATGAFAAAIKAGNID